MCSSIIGAESPQETNEPLPPRNAARRRKLQELRTLANLLDEALRLPGTDFRIGLDALAGLVPVVGDGLTSLISLYIVREAAKLGVRRRVLWRMYGNVAVDFSVGMIPVVGDAFDAAWKCNRRNLRLLEKEFDRQGWTVTQ